MLAPATSTTRDATETFIAAEKLKQDLICASQSDPPSKHDERWICRPTRKSTDAGSDGSALTSQTNIALTMVDPVLESGLRINTLLKLLC